MRKVVFPKASRFFFSSLITVINYIQEAMAILKSSVSPKCQVFGDYSEQVSDTYKLMGSVHLAQGSTEKALHCYKKVN